MFAKNCFAVKFTNVHKHYKYANILPIFNPFVKTKPVLKTKYNNLLDGCFRNEHSCL